MSSTAGNTARSAARNDNVIENEFFVSPNDTLIVEMSEFREGSEDRVTIKKLNVGERTVLTDAAVEYQVKNESSTRGGNRAQRRSKRSMNENSQSDEPTAIATMRSVQIIFLEACIIDWTFRDGVDSDANLIPINKDTIRILDPRVADFLEEKAGEINPT